MADLEHLVEQARAEGDPVGRAEAFAGIVERFQDMAYGYAYAVLGDAAMAQDAAQEAFIAAYRSLGQLQEPQAFPGWFRRIVLNQCRRLTRSARPPAGPLAEADALAAAQPGPAAALEGQEMSQQIEKAIQALPERQRQATVLYYIDGYTQAEVARFLGVPVPVVKERLYRARRTLRERMIDMVREDLQGQRPSKDDRFAQTVRLAAALESAAQESQLALLEAMLVDGLDVNARAMGGQTLLHWAAARGNLEAVEWLLAHGADPGALDDAGRTPLQRALESGHRAVALLLRTRGADR